MLIECSGSWVDGRGGCCATPPTRIHGLTAGECVPWQLTLAGLRCALVLPRCFSARAWWRGRGQVIMRGAAAAVEGRPQRGRQRHGTHAPRQVAQLLRAQQSQRGAVAAAAAHLWRRQHSRAGFRGGRQGSTVSAARGIMLEDKHCSEMPWALTCPELLASDTELQRLCCSSAADASTITH